MLFDYTIKFEYINEKYLSFVFNLEIILFSFIENKFNTMNSRNEFWKNKIKYYFNEILDCNDDGNVDSEDIHIIQEFYKGIKDLNDNSPKFANFVNFLDKWKEVLFAGKERIYVEDFYKYCEDLRTQLLHQNQWPKESYMREYVDALYTILDENNDGFIDLDDYLSIAINDDDKACREASWKLISGNNPAFKLSKESFDSLCKEFLTSVDPTNNGNWIFGVFEHNE